MAKIVGNKPLPKSETNEYESETIRPNSETNGRKDETIQSKSETTPIEDLKTQSIETLLASQADVHGMDPRTMMEFPGNEKENPDIPSNKDGLLNDNACRLGGKRRFMMDALSRALNTDMYLLEQDKAWAKNPLGKGPNISIRYSREFPVIWVLYDNYGLMPDPKIVAFKQKLANEHGYKYIYDTPEQKLNHERLTELLDLQKYVVNPDVAEKEKFEQKTK